MNSEEFYNTYLQFPQICTDSRLVKPGCLHFALKGEKFDGNSFASAAIGKGSAYAIVDNPAVVLDERYILVPDVLMFLQDLARVHRAHLNIPVIGLTGTNGKTTTKELVQAVLKQKYKTTATSGNLNNHIGVPLTLLASTQSTEILIVEMGANHPGEIEFLCNMAMPTIGLITNIGKAHLEGFGSFEGVIKTKNELYDWIKKSQGELLVNEDDDLLKTLTDNYPVTTYGTQVNAGVNGVAKKGERYLTVNWKTRDENRFETISSHLTGDYNLYNILVAITLGVRFNLTKNQIQAGIESYLPENMRSQWVDTADNVLLLDAYNANPSSMSLALKHFASLELSPSIVILGDMFELGDHAAEEHLKMIQIASQLRFSQIWLVGQMFNHFASEFPFQFFGNMEELKEYLSLHKPEQSHILIKGSRGMRLEQLVDYL